MAKETSITNWNIQESQKSTHLIIFLRLVTKSCLSIEEVIEGGVGGLEGKYARIANIKATANPASEEVILMKNKYVFYWKLFCLDFDFS